jgi:hypothetical protein
MEPIDLTIHSKIISEQQKKASVRKECITYPDLEYGDEDQDNCYREPFGNYNHINMQCPINVAPELYSSVCPFEECDMYEDQLRWIKTAPFLSCYFRNPSGARSQNILNGFSRHSMTYHYRYVSHVEYEVRLTSI